MDWSVDGQTPEFLAATRMVSLGDSIVATILDRTPLAPGMRVLDVGCGSGEYCFRLGSAVHGVEFTGLEYDPAFVEFANRRATGEVGYPFEEPNRENTYRFVCGDGLDLPFPDDSFDAVVSHTYLTAVPDWACALAEMCRVCKPGGAVSSITSMTENFYGSGTIGLFNKLFDPSNAVLLRLVEQAKAKAFPSMDLISGIAPRKVPVAFDWIGLSDVSCAALAHYFCLSDAMTEADFARRYVDLLRAMEHGQAKRLKAHPEASAILTEGQWQAYERLIDARCDELLGQEGANREWNWYGNTSLLVCGTAPQELDSRWAAFRNESRVARKALTMLGSGARTVEQRVEQLGPGRCMKVTLAIDELTADAWGFDPPRALLEACGKIAVALNNDGVTGTVADLADLERRCKQVESSVSEGLGDFGDLPAFDNDDVYSAATVWETVSEAALAGTAAAFRDAGTADGLHVVACIMASTDGTAQTIAAHPDLQEAAMRAFSRAYGALA